MLAPAFALWGSPVTWLEIAAFVLALLMVWANLRVNPVGWPLAILSSLMYALLFADSRLYGEAILQFVFVALAGWGWWQWLRGTTDAGAPLRVHRLSTRSRAVALAITLAAWPTLALALGQTTDSDVPWFDALPTAGSLTGQVLLARKVVENWPVWLAVNLVSVALFALLSLVGWRAWRRLEHAGG